MGAAKLIVKEQIRAIYGLGAALGILERGNPDDDLHALAEALTGSSHISKLTESQGRAVLAELRRRAGGTQQRRREPKQHPTTPGGMTDGQQRKVWKLMYELSKASPSDTPTGRRLCGVIHKELGIDAVPRNPFQWLDYKQGGRLIEALKKYVNHADVNGKDGGAGAGIARTAESSAIGGPEG